MFFPQGLLWIKQSGLFFQNFDQEPTVGRKLVVYIFVKLAFYILEFWVVLGYFFLFFDLEPACFSDNSDFIFPSFRARVYLGLKIKVLFFRVFVPILGWKPEFYFSKSSTQDPLWIENSGFINPGFLPQTHSGSKTWTTHSGSKTWIDFFITG